MHIGLLFARFDDLLATPDDVTRLEAAILQLAVQGKLVPQDPEDEPATELLERIRAEKEHLVRGGEIRKPKAISLLEDNDTPYKLPRGWLWTSLVEISLDIHYGYTASADFSREDYRLLRITDIQNNTVDWQSVPGCQIDEKEVSKYLLQENDILIARTGGTIGKSYLVQNLSVIALFASYLIRVIPSREISPRYLKLFLESPLYWQQLTEKSKGTGQPNVNATSLSQLAIPLPPLAEQKRIVAKVDDLLAQTRALAARLEQADAALVPAAQAAFQALPDAPDATAQRAAWQRVADHFDTLTNDPRTLLALKQTILQLAVEGKLVPQNPEDEPASVLLERIETEQTHAVSEDQAKKSKRPPPISEQEQPYKIPEGWVWTHLPEIGELARGKSRHRPRNAPELYENGKYPFIQTGDVAQSGGKITSYTTMYGDVGLAQSRMWKKGTLCITIAANIAETGILQFDACFPDSVVGFVPSELVGSVEYFQYLIQVAKNQLEAYAPATAQKNINLGILQNLLIPLPPANEIKRIVATVEGLLALCDALAAGVVQAEAVRGRVLGALCNSLAPDVLT